MRKEFVFACVLFGCGRGESARPEPKPAPSASPGVSIDVKDSEPVAAPEIPPVESTSPGEEPSEAPSPTEPPEPSCLASYSFDSDTSVLSEQRRRGGAARWDDFASRYPAAYLDPDTDRPVEVVESTRIGDTPLLWFRPDFSEAIVNAAVLSELKVVDATGLGVGQREVIGTLGELGRGKIEGRELAHFLLRADVVQTYVHIGSSVCLVEEASDEGGYRARFTGEHVYFTNGEQRDAFAFEIQLGPQGEISVAGTG